MTKKLFSGSDVLLVTLGELAVSLLVIAGYLVADLAFAVPFTYRVITGVVLGSAVTVLNFLFLSISVNRAVDKYITLRGTKEMSDEEAEKFAAENSMQIQNSIKLSFIVRTITLLATLVVAFLIKVFDPIATVIPLIMYRPIITVANLIKAKLFPEPVPEYTAQAVAEATENEEEKED